MNSIEDELNAYAEKTPHVLSEDEALVILNECSNYFDADPHTGNRHRTEVVAETMERSGEFSLASDVLDVHKAMHSVKNGDMTALTYYEECPVPVNLESAAKETKFVQPVADIAKAIKRSHEILCGNKIDWEKSSAVLAKVRKENFPEWLTMVEKLSDWQRKQTHGKQT